MEKDISQIDHILVRHNDKKHVRDCRVEGEPIGVSSDHLPVKAVLRLVNFIPKKSKKVKKMKKCETIKKRT